MRLYEIKVFFGVHAQKNRDPMATVMGDGTPLKCARIGLL
jgi:hypothetical protein